jgi:hypothetical protein
MYNVKEPQNKVELTPQDANIIKDVLIYNSQDFQKKEKTNITYKSGLSKKEVLDANNDNLLLFLEEGRQYLESVSESAARLTNKGYILLGIVTTIMGFLTDNIYGNWSTKQQYSIPLILYDVLLLFPFFILLKFFVYPFDRYPLGTEPKNILSQKILNYNSNELIHNLLLNYQTKIQSNEKNKDCMSFWFKICFLLILIPALLLLISFFCYNFQALRNFIT